MQRRVGMTLAPEEAPGRRRVDVQAGDQHRRRIPSPGDDQRVRLEQVQFRQDAGIEMGAGAGDRRMEAAKHRMRMPHLRRIIRPVPARLRLRAIQHMEPLARTRRRLRQSVEERRAVRSRDVGEYDEAHRFEPSTLAHNG